MLSPNGCNSDCLQIHMEEMLLVAWVSGHRMPCRQTGFENCLMQKPHTHLDNRRADGSGSGGAQGMAPESKRDVARALTHTLKLSLRHKVRWSPATGAVMLPCA